MEGFFLAFQKYKRMKFKNLNEENNEEEQLVNGVKDNKGDDKHSSCSINFNNNDNEDDEIIEEGYSLLRLGCGNSLMRPYNDYEQKAIDFTSRHPFFD